MSQIIAFTPNPETEQQLLRTGVYITCDTQAECGFMGAGRPMSIFWRHNDAPENVVPRGWTRTPQPHYECPFCAQSTMDVLTEEEYDMLEHDQEEIDTMRGATGATSLLELQGSPSLSSSPSSSSPSPKPASIKSKTPSKAKKMTDKAILEHAKKLGIPPTALKAMKGRLKQNRRDLKTKRFSTFSPESYTPPSKTKKASKKTSKKTTKKASKKTSKKQ